MKPSALFATLLIVSTVPAYACDLTISDQWVREPLPATTSLAAYGILHNAGDKPLTITATSSADFRSIETHESILENGVGKMRPVVIQIPAKGSVELKRGGKHFMLIDPRKALKTGDYVVLRVKDSSGCTGDLQFKVGNKATDAGGVMPPSKMEH